VRKCLAFLYKRHLYKLLIREHLYTFIEIFFNMRYMVFNANCVKHNMLNISDCCVRPLLIYDCLFQVLSLLCCLTGGQKHFMLTTKRLMIAAGTSSSTSPWPSALFTARRVCIARTMPWQDVSPSVCLSHAGIECKRLYIPSKNCHHPVAPPF